VKNLTLKFQQSMIRRITETKETLQVNTQRIRGKLLESLERQFEIADGFAKDESLKPRQRQFWMRISAYIGQVMNSVAKGFDESKISKQLDELERMIREGSGKETQTT